MEKITSDGEVLDIVYDAFALSHDFNGIGLANLAAKLQVDLQAIQQILKPLLEGGKVTLSFERHTGNPHIKRLKDLPIQTQISQMGIERAEGICVYPSSALAADRIGIAFDDEPYSKRLALVEPQLTPVFFELPVLERYFRDPRYSCRFGDSNGTISIGDRAYQSEKTQDRDKISIQSFGIGYTADRERVVVVFLRDLSGISAEHQLYWRTHEVSDRCTMNSDFERASIWGDWPKFHSAYSAFIQEQVEINAICERIGKPHLFKKTFEDHKRPLLFCSMLRPTKACFDDFVHLLDKMLSDNIDRAFFKGDIPLEEEIIRDDNSVAVRQLGTLALLEHWLKRHYKDRDGVDVSKKAVEPFKAIRKARQPVAHSIGQDEYDLALPSMQDDLVGTMKGGLSRLRWILSSHPDASTYRAPEWLDGDKIVFY